MLIKNVDSIKPVFRALFNQAEIMIKSGKVIDVDITEHKEKRSNEQNAYYWVFNGEVASFLYDAGCSYGEHKLPYTSDLVHEINKTVFGIKTTTKMDVKCFCEYMTKLLIWWQEKTGGEFMCSELPTSYLQRKGYDIR